MEYNSNISLEKLIVRLRLSSWPSARLLASMWPMLRCPLFLSLLGSFACGVLLCCCRSISKNYTS